jgi:excisionase family DNA binding protein
MTLQAIKAVLREATEAPPSRLQRLRGRLREALATLTNDPMVTTGEAAKLLGVSSPNTIKNWLTQKGFARAQRTLGGQYRFPLSDILAVKTEMEKASRRRAERKLPIRKTASTRDFN